ncbi:hypothetical protein RFI_06579 [Reticulomyxa filosa]|uniref:Uncharacterized protein n=1 Tax=Reticulomyxa filosa TaxID=46433 RepID=X6NW60_RETFI|nr:hypothetical protein RFI_06579 [Reticulomyxa filosa]|eukprot:ETO30540.1 hypothetical protein RFI_06579 [Reticulomyxa filosa]
MQYIDVYNRPSKRKVLSEEQFISLSGDGVMYYWNIAEPVLTDAEKKKKEEPKWVPIGSLKLDHHALLKNVANVSEMSEDTHNNFGDEKNSENSTEMKSSKEETNLEDPILQFNETGEYPSTHNTSNEESTNGAKNNYIFACVMTHTPLVGQIIFGTQVKFLGEIGVLRYGVLDKKEAIERNDTQLCSEFLEVQLAKRFSSIHLNNSEKCVSSADLANPFLQMNELKVKEDERSFAQLEQNISRGYDKMFRYHCMYVQNLQMSPHCYDICLSVADWTFCIWQLGSDVKFFFVLTKTEKAILRSFNLCYCQIKTESIDISKPLCTCLYYLWMLVTYSSCCGHHS